MVIRRSGTVITATTAFRTSSHLETPYKFVQDVPLIRRRRDFGGGRGEGCKISRQAGRQDAENRRNPAVFGVAMWYNLHL